MWSLRQLRNSRGGFCRGGNPRSTHPLEAIESRCRGASDDGVRTEVAKLHGRFVRYPLIRSPCGAQGSDRS